MLVIILILWGNAWGQPTVKVNPSPIAPELTFDQIIEELLPALYAKDENRIQRIVEENPTTMFQVYQALLELGKGQDRESESYRHVASLLESFLPENMVERAQDLSKQFEIWGKIDEQFLEELVNAAQTKDIGRFQQLIIANPDATEQFQQHLEELGAGTGEKAQQARAFAEILREFRSTVLNQFYEAGQQAYEAFDYQAALKEWQQGLKQAQLLKEQIYVGMFLTRIGIMYEQWGKYQQALESYQEVLTIHQENGNLQMEGVVLGGIGTVYKELGQYQKALEYFERASLLMHKLDESQGESLNLEIMGGIYKETRQYNKALEYYEKALAINRNFGYRQSEGDILEKIGTLYGTIGEHQQALEFYNKALAIFQEIDLKSREGELRNNIGITYKELGQFGEALTQLKQAVAIQHKLENIEGEGNALSSLANVYSSSGEYQDALRYYKQALTIARDSGDQRNEGGTLTNIGIVYNELGQYQEALAFHNQALIILKEKLSDRQGEGSVRINLGNVYCNLGQYHDALENYNQALEIMRDFSNRQGEGLALLSLGNVYSLMGRYQQALKYYDQALVIDHHLGDQGGEGRDLNNLGGLYMELGQYQKAINSFEKALVIAKNLEDRSGEGVALSNLSSMYVIKKDYQQALSFSRQALIIQRSIGEQGSEAGTLENIGEIYIHLGNYQQAVEYFTEALTILHDIGDRRGEGRSLTDIGMVYYEQGEYQKALNSFQEGLDILEKLGALSDLWPAQRGIAAVEVKLNRLGLAVNHYKQALDHIEALRTELDQKRHKLSFMRSKLFVYDELIELLQELHRQYPGQDYDRKALEIFERKQGRVFLEEIGQSSARRFAWAEENLAEKEFDLLFQLEQTDKQLLDERSKLITEQNEVLIQNLQERKQSLESEQAALQKQIKDDYPEYYNLKYPEPVALSKLQHDVLQSDELMLVYGVMEEKTILWVISKAMMHMYTLPVGEVELQKQVRELRERLWLERNSKPDSLYEPSSSVGDAQLQKGNDKLQDALIQEEPKRGDDHNLSPSQVTFTQASHALYTLLIPDKEVRSLLQSPYTLFIVPTGPLYALPFETLITRPAENFRDAEYLITKLPISYLSSASLLKTLRQAASTKKDAAPYPLLAFADPTFNSPQWPKLGETADEVHAIKDFLEVPEKPALLQLGEKASRTNVFALNVDERLDDYQYLIFATHGALPGEGKFINPLGETETLNQSALVLSDANRISGYLTMSDIFQLRLNAKLVSLSACNTGSGEQERGEGVRGLTRPFMYAGTPAVAITLWGVNSFSARDLDVGFFEHIKAKKTPVDALRAIKLQMLRGEISNEKGIDYRHPYYWAPFVLFGDGR